LQIRVFYHKKAVKNTTYTVGVFRLRQTGTFTIAAAGKEEMRQTTT